MPSVTFIIDKSGNTKIEGVEGVVGNECLAVTKPFENALGSVDESSRNYHECFDEERTVTTENKQAVG